MKVLLHVGSKNGVLYDSPYHTSSSENQKKNVNLRHVIYRDPLTQKIFHFVCSDLKISARAIADIYKKRWAVELLFRWLKGHLDIRRLPTKTINAVRTMLATAVLFQLLLQLKKITDKFKGTLWDLLRFIRSALVKKCLADGDPPDGCRWNTMVGAVLKS